MKKEKLVTLNEALPTTVNVFGSVANNSAAHLYDYGVLNERCINYYIYHAAQNFRHVYYPMVEYVDEDNNFYLGCGDDDFYTIMFRDIYKIYWDAIKKIAKNNT